MARSVPAPAADAPRDVLVLGLGSVLMGDDAVGPWVIQLLESSYRFPPAVALLDAGTPGPELAHYLAGLDALIVIDSLRYQGLPPGTVRVLREEEIRKHLPTPRLSPHDPSLRDALLATEVLGGPPGDFCLVGVVPESVELRTRLSETVQEALPQLAAAVVAELERLGVAPIPVPRPAPPHVWWEQGQGAAPAEPRHRCRSTP